VLGLLREVSHFASVEYMLMGYIMGYMIDAVDLHAQNGVQCIN
jgi:hypothetical protein